MREHENEQTVQEIIDKQTAELKVVQQVMYGIVQHACVYTQAQLTTLNAEAQRHKERNSNNEKNVSKLTTELSEVKQVATVADSLICHVQPMYCIITSSTTQYIIHRGKNCESYDYVAIITE